MEEKVDQKDNIIKVLVAAIVAGLTILIGFGTFIAIKTKNIINPPKK